MPMLDVSGGVHCSSVVHSGKNLTVHLQAKHYGVVHWINCCCSTSSKKFNTPVQFEIGNHST